MSKAFLAHVRHNGVAYLAMFVALGGTTYAAVRLPANSVGNKQLKKNAVTSKKIKSNAVTTSKVKDFSLLKTDFAPGQLPAGPSGPPGPAGQPGAKGDTGSAGPLVTTLPSGATLRGMYGYAGHEATGFSPVYAISYQFPLAAPPTRNVIDVSGASTTACPGTAANPQAAPGNLCVYQSRNDSGTSLAALNEVVGGRFGAVLFASLPTNTDYEFEGTWAVTGA